MTPAEFAQQKRLEFPDLAGFSDQDIIDNFPVPFDAAPAAPAPAASAPVTAPSGAFERFVSSPVASVLGGFEGIARGVDTVAQLATRQEGFTPVKSTFELPGRALAAGAALVSGQEVGDFWAPVDSKAAIEGMKSSQFQQAVAERAQAMDKAGTIFGSEGLGQAWAGIKETVTSPDLILDMVASQLPQLAAMAATGGGARAVTAVGAGLQGASSAADRLSEDAAKLKAMTPEQALAVPAIKALVDEGSSIEDAKATVMLNAATMTLGLSTVGSLLATKLTGGQLEKLIGRLASGVPVKAVGTVGESAVKEFAQEALEEGTGQLASNIGAQQISPDTELMKGVLAAAGIGGVGGAIIGGGLSGLVGGQRAAPAPAVASATQPAAKPVFSYGDIVAPNEAQNYFIAPATIDGEELQFTGATQAEAEAQRDAAIAQLTPAGATPEAARVDQVVREGLMSAGLSADQIAQLSPEQATELLNRVVQQTPDLVDAANAEAVERRTVALANALGNLATAKQAEFDAQLKVADNQAAIDKVTAEAAKWRTEAEASRTKLENLRAQAAEAKARKAQAEAATAEAQATKSRAKGVALRGKPVTGEETVAPGPVVTPFTGGEQAAQAEGVPSGTVKVAAVPTAPGPVAVIESTVSPTTQVEAEMTGEIVPTPSFVAPTQSFTLAAREPELKGEPGKEPEKIRGKTTRGDTRYAAVFSDASGNRVAIPVFYKGEKPELRVLLDTRSRAKALAGLNKLPVERRDAAAIETVAKAAGFPLLNEATLSEYASAKGLIFTGVVFKSDKRLDPGAYASPTVRNDLVPPGSVLFPAAEGSDRKIKRKTLGGYSQSTQDRLVRALQDSPNLLKDTQGVDPWAAGEAALKVISAQQDIPVGFSKLRVSESLDTKRTALASAYGLLELARGRATPLKVGRSRSEVLASTEPTPAPAPIVEGRLSEEERRAAEERVVERALVALRSYTPRADKLLAEVMKPEHTADPVAFFAKFTERFGERFERGLANKPEETQALALNLLNGVRAALSAPKDAPATINEIESTISETRDISLSGAAADKPYPPYRPVLDLFDILSSLSSVTSEKITARIRVNSEVAPVKERSGWKALVGSNATPEVILKVWDKVARVKAEIDPSVPADKQAAYQEAEDKALRKELFANILATGSAAGVELTSQEEISVDQMNAVGLSEVTELLRTDRTLTAQETQELGSYRGETDTVQFLRNLAARGVNVSFTDLKNAVAGRFSEGHVAIFANWADRASASTFGVALHEATHHFVSQLPPAARLALHRSVDQLTGRLIGRSDVDPRVGFKSYADYLASKPEQVLSPSAWAEEVIAETAALNGMDRAVSRTMWAMIMRQVKLLALRVNMYLQEQFMGPDGVNPEFVSKWVDAQIDATIAGDYLRLMSLATRYSKIRPTLGKMVLNTVDDRHHWQSQQMNPLTGEISYLGSLDSTASAAESRIYQTVAAFKQQAMQNGSWHRAENEEALAGPLGLEKSPVNPIVENASIMIARATESAETSIAAHNELLKPFMAAWGKVQQIMPELSEPSRAMNKRLGLPVPEAMPIERVAQLAGFDLSAADAAKAALVQTVVDETKVTPPAEFTARLASSLDELKTPGATAAAQQIIFNSARKSANAVARRLAAGNSRLVDLEAVQQRTAARLAKFTTDPKDWKEIDLDIKEKISASFDAILKAKDAFGDSEVQMAEAAALMDKALTRAEARAEFDKNAQDIFAKANIEGITLHSMLRELMALNSDDPYYKYRIDFNWGSKRIYDTVVSYVTENPKSALAELTTQESRGQVRGTAILASLIKYARDNELAIELARAATVKGDLHTAALLEYQAFMRDATDKKLDELAALQKAQKEIPTNRFIQKALNARDKYIKASDDIAVLKQELAVLRVLNGVFQQAKKLAEDSLGYQNEIYTHHPEAMFAHPTSPDDKIEDIFSSPRVKKVGTRSNAELRQVIQDVREYLEANRDRPESKGDLFNRLQRQNIAMIQAISAPDKVRNARSGLFGALIEGTAGLFRAPGSPSGDRVAARITRYSAILDVLRNVAKKISSDYERNAAAFRKAAGGISDTEFYDNFFTEASNLAQVINADREEIHDRIDQRFSTNESTKEAWAKPGAKRAFWAFLDSVERAAVAAQKMQADHGADLVTDPTTGGFRKQIRRGYLTFPQHTNAALKTWASAVHPDFSADEHPKNFFTKYKLMANADERRAEMARFLGKDGWDIFLAPLLGNDLESVRGPRHADGSNYNLSTDRAKTLVRLANGDFFRFAELAYLDNPGSPQTLEDYTNSLIDQVGKVWKQVSVHAVDKAPVASLRVNPGIPNIGIDARATQTWPIGWKAPMQFNEDGMRRFIAGVAGVAAFGRDMSDTILDISAMQAEIQNRIDTLKAKYNKPGLSEREQMVDWNMPKRLLTAAGVSSSDWQQYNALQDYAKVDWASRITRSLNPDGTLGLNDKLSMELWGTYVMNLTAGFRSALKNPVSGLNQFALAGEFSPDSVKDTLGNYGQLLKQVAASVAQSLPFVDPLSSDVSAQAMYEMGVYDAVTDVNLSDSLKGGLSSTGEHHPAVTFLRRLKEVYKDTRLGFSKGKRGVALRAFDVFNWSQLTTQMGAVANNLNIYYEIVQRMADYGRSGGNLLVTPNAKQIGLRGSEVRYNNMVKAWEEAGGSDMLTLASELAANPAMSELDIKKRLVPTVNKIVSDRISAASSISANPAWINSSRVGRLGGTFLGWSLRQGGTFAKPFINAETNTVSAASLMRGASMVALGMLPGVLAYSMLLDMFDDMTERKRDKVELRLSSQQSKDNFVQSLVEAIQDVGVFSLPGDLATTLVNAYQGTGNKGPSFSLDNRLVAVSAFNNFTRLFRDLMVYGPENMVLSTSGMQAIQTLGGTAWLSNLETLNRLTGADVGGVLATYGERQDRVSINNYIREAGRLEGLPVRQYGTFDGSNPPAPMSPWISEMQLAALNRDEARFERARAQAYKIALKEAPSPKEAWAKVATRYASKHPLRSAFKDRITPMEIQNVINRIDELHPGKSKMVQEAMVDFNKFGSRIPLFRPVVGAKPSIASVKRGEEARAQRSASWW